MLGGIILISYKYNILTHKDLVAGQCHHKR